MKLCWKLLNDPNALWVCVLTNKYQTVTSSTLCLRKGKSASTTWISICAIWSKFIKGLGVKVGNGSMTSFWFDNWSQLNAPLVQHTPGCESLVDGAERVIDYTTPWGAWDVVKLRRWFSPNTIARITSVSPPNENRGEDRFIWKPSSDGRFFC